MYNHYLHIKSNIGRYISRKQIKKQKELFLLLLIPVVLLFIFQYKPMYGILIAFKDYSFRRGVLGSPWNNFAHFKDLLADPFFYRVFRNTILISINRLIFVFPAPILFALLLNEIKNEKFKRITQSISYLPHFMSWTILAVMITEVVSPQRGILAYLATVFDTTNIYILTDATRFRSFLVMTDIWKGIGWGSIVYLAALSGVDPQLYEASEVDGANRFQNIIHITLPSLIPVIIIMFLLQIGNIMNAGFDQIFNLYSPLVYEVADIIDTYVYRSGVVEGRYDMATAVGLFKNVIGVTLIVFSNLLVRKYSEFGLW